MGGLLSPDLPAALAGFAASTVLLVTVAMVVVDGISSPLRARLV